MSRLREFWSRLQPRERHVLIAGAAALILLGGYTLVWSPYRSEMRSLRTSVAQQRETLAWMRQAAREVKALRGQARHPKTAGDQSVLAVVDTTARSGGLGPALKRVQPDGQNGVRVWLEGAGFDALVRWLATLYREQGVRVTSATVERVQAPGQVNARLVLERGT